MHERRYVPRLAFSWLQHLHHWAIHNAQLVNSDSRQLLGKEALLLDALAVNSRTSWRKSRISWRISWHKSRISLRTSWHKSRISWRIGASAFAIASANHAGAAASDKKSYSCMKIRQKEKPQEQRVPICVRANLSLSQNL